MKILVYGSRDWDDLDAIHDFLSQFPSTHTTVAHGDARGADRLGGEAAIRLGMTVVTYPADWELHGRAAGPIRNKEMLEDFQPTVAAGFRMPGISKGTDHMTGLLGKAGIPTHINHKEES